jgi:hypothetical protein
MKDQAFAYDSRNKARTGTLRSWCPAVLTLLAAIGCDNSKPARQMPTDSAVHAAIEEEKATIVDVATGKSRYAARSAARKYVLTTIPGARVRGLSAVYIDANNYVVAVDLAEPSQGVLVLLARQFFSDDGTRYWKASPIDRATSLIYGQIWDRDRAVEEGAVEESMPNTESR